MLRIRAVVLAIVLMGIAGRAFAAEPPVYADLIKRVGAHLRVSPTVITAVIEVESDFEPAARSHAGAIGLMQLMPHTGAREAYRYLYGHDAIPTDAALRRPEVSIWLGTAYLHILAERYFDWIEAPELRLRAILTAYNWGPTRVLERLLPGREAVSVEQFLTRLRVHAPRETQDYVRRVLAVARKQTTPALASR